MSRLFAYLLLAVFSLSHGVLGQEKRGEAAVVKRFIMQFMLCEPPLNHGCDLLNDGAYDAALEDFESHASKGSMAAQNNIGVMIESGYGAEQDAAQAMEKYRLAAVNGVAMAQYNLGVLLAADHLLGTVDAARDRHADFVQAYRWLLIASENGNKYAKQGKLDLGKHLTPDQIAEAERLARDWLERHPRQ